MNVFKNKMQEEVCCLRKKQQKNYLYVAKSFRRKKILTNRFLIPGLRQEDAYRH
jgi:hypothetical protein